MASANKLPLKALIQLLLLCVCVYSWPSSQNGLQINYYLNTCPSAEFIVKDQVQNAANDDRGLPASLIRLHFHDCFVRGCDGSVLIDSTDGNKAEKDAAANVNSLRGFDVIDNIKEKLEDECPGIVSCADILAFAARDSFEIAGNLGPFGGYDVPSGRLDGKVSIAKEAQQNLPAPIFNLDQLTKSFASKGLSQRDMVTLSGAHTIGQSHCSSFSKRLYSKKSGLDPNYAAELMQECPDPTYSNQNPFVFMDPITPADFDNTYYKSLIKNRGLFTSDQALLTSKQTTGQVNQYAVNQEKWLDDFKAAMVKMGNIDVITRGSQKREDNEDSEVPQVYVSLEGITVSEVGPKAHQKKVRTAKPMHMEGLQKPIKSVNGEHVDPIVAKFNILTSREESSGNVENGCDASVLIDSTDGNKVEKNATPNVNSLRRFDVIDDIKADLERICPSVVSCADAAKLDWWDGYEVPCGRLDGKVSIAQEAQKNLPAPTFNLDQLTKSFTSAHTIGLSHCTSFKNRLYDSSKRLYGFSKSKSKSNKNSKRDTRMDPDYADELRKKCPKYNSQKNSSCGLLTSNQALLETKESRYIFNTLNKRTGGNRRAFIDAILAMGNIQVLTDKNGEIRLTAQRSTAAKQIKYGLNKDLYRV
ncbi:peroxidase [Striga asiatica]|uniref:peroxidase n=1 Tax=Striga asiatica TaxID=4170 RepID=A0A5A7PLC6_STRAF|nr:peroxidase [Striga asiatica]